MGAGSDLKKLLLEELEKENLLLAKKAAKARDQIVKETQKQAHSFVEKLYKEKYNQFVDEYYDNYTPKIYSRNHTMYDLVLLEEFDDNADSYYEVTFDVVYQKAIINGGYLSDYLYDLIVLRGYHGGATSGEGHPDEGTPYYRRPHPYYTTWGTPAASDSESIVDKWNDWIETEFNQSLSNYMQSVYDSKVSNIAEYINKVGD